MGTAGHWNHLGEELLHVCLHWHDSRTGLSRGLLTSAYIQVPSCGLTSSWQSDFSKCRFYRARLLRLSVLAIQKEKQTRSCLVSYDLALKSQSHSCHFYHILWVQAVISLPRFVRRCQTSPSGRRNIKI
jgi:hypothetical protein